jgi:hypothetical protein
MLGYSKLVLEKGYLSINKEFDKLITALRTAVSVENTLDKESTSYNDCFDAFRLALKYYVPREMKLDRWVPYEDVIEIDVDDSLKKIISSHLSLANRKIVRILNGQLIKVQGDW